MSGSELTKEPIYTPEEIAGKLKVSTATVYKLIGQGDIPYFKVGKSYRTPASALESFMMREGNLARFLGGSPKVPVAARQFVKLVDAAPAELKDKIAQVILFGSYARGDADEGSDIDLLVLLKDASPSTEEHISDISTRAMEEGGYEEFLSPIRMTLAHWRMLAESGSPLYEEIGREGIELWPSA